MNKICTDIEQSQKLIELGIDVSTADMYWWATSKRYYIEAMDDGDFNERAGHVPAWSLSALLGLIPKPLLGQHLESGYWECTTWEDFNVAKEVHGQDNPLDAAFEMVCWLLENKKL